MSDSWAKKGSSAVRTQPDAWKRTQGFSTASVFAPSFEAPAELASSIRAFAAGWSAGRIAGPVVQRARYGQPQQGAQQAARAVGIVDAVLFVLGERNRRVDLVGRAMDVHAMTGTGEHGPQVVIEMRD